MSLVSEVVAPLIRTLDKIAARRSQHAAHLTLGRSGELEAYFYLQNLGYRIVETSFRAPGCRGEIDIIGWDGNVLCFVEVKTRSHAGFAPPSAAVDSSKQQSILEVARKYVAALNKRPTCRFDIVSVVDSGDGVRPQIKLEKAAFTWPRHEGRQIPRDPQFQWKPAKFLSFR